MSRRRFDLVLLAAVGILLAGIAQFAPFLYPYEVGPLWNPIFATAAFAGDLLWVAAMLVTYSREPGGRMWKLLLLARLVGAIGSIWVIPTSLTWTLWQMSIGLGTLVFVHLVLAFPSGRLSARYDRTLLRLAYGTFVVARLLWLIVWDPRSPSCAPRCPVNPFVIWPQSELAWLLGAGLGLLMPLLYVLVMVALGRRWMQASPALRRALLPIALVAPIELGIAALRYAAAADAAAYELVSVTILSTPLSFIHAAIPAGFLLGLLGNRLARGGVADLAIELGRGVPLGGLRDRLARSLRDPTLELAFPAPAGDGFVDSAGQPTEIDRADSDRRALARLEHEGQTLAVLMYDPAIELEDPGRVAAVASVARMALQNERLAAQVRAQLDEVRASRSRILQAADAERRRIERDLHDGAQQRLVALAMRLDQARGQAVGAADLIDATNAELMQAISEVRDLARGIHPTILSEAGLAAAIDALAERTPTPITVNVADVRFAPAVEATAYFLVAEALTNIARYAAATEARVDIDVEDGLLLVSVSDNGRGGADPSAGSGLSGLYDRVAAVGGTLTITSPAGGGTMLRASIPAS